jgi:hypothetical protein
MPLQYFRTYSDNAAYSTVPLHAVPPCLSLGLQHPMSMSIAYAHLAPKNLCRPILSNAETRLTRE